MIDDPDDGRVNRSGLSIQRFAGRTSFQHDENLLMHPGAHAVDGEQRHAAGRVVEVQRLYEEQLRAFELAVLLGRYDRSDDSGDLHYPRSQ